MVTKVTTHDHYSEGGHVEHINMFNMTTHH